MAQVIDFNFIDWLFNQNNPRYEYFAEVIKQRQVISPTISDEIQEAYLKYLNTNQSNPPTPSGE